MHGKDGTGKMDTNDNGSELLVAELFKLQQKGGKYWAVDDVSGAELDVKLVQEARKLEMEYFRKMGVYKKVQRPYGTKTIKTRWLDVNKGDSKCPDMRSRLVGKEFNDGVDPSIFAGTPPLESLRMVISRASTRGGPRKKQMVNYVKRACFHARATRDIYIEIPAEDKVPGEGDVVGKLELCLYGTRDAALNWQKTVQAHLESLGFVSSKAFPNIYHHVNRGICTLVHGDDYASSGTQANLEWLKAGLERKFEIKTTIIGHEKSDDTECKILKRMIRVTPEGYEYEADPRRADLIVEQLKVGESKGVVTAGIDEISTSPEGEAVRLDEAKTWQYRSLAARGNYQAFDRPDIGFAVKELSRDMSTPTTQSWERLKRLAKYLKFHPRLVWDFHWQDEVTVIDTLTDANWARCKSSRRSTSGGVIMAGSHLIKFWSKTQATIALSSAESELIASVKEASESLGVMTLLEDFGVPVTTRLHMDASAAIGIIQRRGIGKIRHLSTSLLWVQEQELRQAIQIQKIDGAKNSSDLLTKHVQRELVERHCKAISCHFASGRAQKAAELHRLQTKVIDKIKMLQDFEDSVQHHGCSSGEINIDGRLNQLKEIYHQEHWHGQAQEDRWRYNGSENAWIRSHAQPRMGLFTPFHSWRGPQSMMKLSGHRITRGTYIGGGEFCIEDNWKDSSQCHRLLREPWIGSTTFASRHDEPTCQKFCSDKVTRQPGPRGGAKYARQMGDNRQIATEGTKHPWSSGYDVSLTR